MKYRLMPYVYAQSVDSSKKGFPVLRPLFFEYPEDSTSWLIEDEYLFGSDILVAPLFEEVNERKVYLPPGTWVDYQSGESYKGGQWYKMMPHPIPCAILVRAGAVIPHVALAQSTKDMDWSKMELKVYGSEPQAKGFISLPKDNVLRQVVLEQQGHSWRMQRNPLPKVKFTVQAG
jgi:alpha-D-xyloside xylohydrolase